MKTYLSFLLLVNIFAVSLSNESYPDGWTDSGKYSMFSSYTYYV